MSNIEKHENNSHELVNTDHKTLERRIVRKCDIYVLPLLSIAYLLSVIDLDNVGNATVAGYNYMYFNTTPFAFTLAVSAHFFGYMIFEIPSSLVTNILGFHVWLPILMVGWSISSAVQAACTNVTQLGFVRFLLGAFQAGVQPSIVTYISLFYAKKELALRYSVLLTLLTLGGALSGFASYFIVQISGTSLSGFQWLFVIESIPTILMALIIALFMSHGPGNARFFTPEEREFEIERLKSEGSANEIDSSLAKSQVKLAFIDILTYSYLIIFLITGIPFYALNFYLPTLVSQLGYDNIQAQLMVIPPLVISTVFMIVCSWYSDKYQIKANLSLLSYSLSIISLVGMLLTRADNPSLYNLRYFLVIVLACGVYSVVPVVFSWFTCNIPGQYKRSTMTAIILTANQIGGVVGLLIFPATDAPSFYMGNIVCLAAVILASILVFGMKFYFESLNKKRDLAILANHNYKLNDNDLKDNKKIREIAMELVEKESNYDELLCDKHPNWRYIT
ncbi:major facilitator superfamily domain-containing protein [Gigaspora margarita]|uniref:Major facilitator superfamily domain-containing protein n=1 Tax=Gigaspora margarita TaxID=4874 RepID=A0A8H4AT90_GIGMA|nr:major facilitator superfamily domain-containing protein [Gigaspora margarita]